MQLGTLELLLSLDDPIHCDDPPGFAYDTGADEVATIKNKLEEKLNVFINIYFMVQDITYFCELSIKYNDEFCFILVQFSQFGSLFTVLVVPEQCSPPLSLVNSVLEIVSSASFVYVENTILDQPYTGSNPNFNGGLWRNRFFGTWDEL